MVDASKFKIGHVIS